LPEWTLAELAERIETELAKGAHAKLLRYERQLTRPPARALTDWRTERPLDMGSMRVRRGCGSGEGRLSLHCCVHRPWLLAELLPIWLLAELLPWLLTELPTWLLAELRLAILSR